MIRAASYRQLLSTKFHVIPRLRCLSSTLYPSNFKEPFNDDVAESRRKEHISQQVDKRYTSISFLLENCMPLLNMYTKNYMKGDPIRLIGYFAAQLYIANATACNIFVRPSCLFSSPSRETILDAEKTAACFSKKDLTVPFAFFTSQCPTSLINDTTQDIFRDVSVINFC